MQDALMESVREGREIARLNGFKNCQARAMAVLLEMAKSEPLGHTYDLLHKAFTQIAEMEMEPIN